MAPTSSAPTKLECRVSRRALPRGAATAAAGPPRARPAQSQHPLDEALGRRGREDKEQGATDVSELLLRHVFADKLAHQNGEAGGDGVGRDAAREHRGRPVVAALGAEGSGGDEGAVTDLRREDEDESL